MMFRTPPPRDGARRAWKKYTLSAVMTRIGYEPVLAVAPITTR